MVNFYNIFVFQSLLKGGAALKIHFIISITSSYNSFSCSIYCFSISWSIYSFSSWKFPNKLAPNVPNSILRNTPFCSFTSFWTVSVTPFNNRPESSRDFTILIMSYISLFDIISVVVLLWPDPNIFLCIPASAADAAAVNPKELKNF